MMRHLIIDAYGCIENLTIRNQEIPEPGPKEVLIEIKASGIGYVDGLLVQGHYQVKPPLPYVPGMSVSGVITALGREVADLHIGDRVAATSPLGGGFASHMVTPALTTVVLPDAIGHEQAAAMLESWGTMYFAFTRRTSITDGARVLVLGAGGGIGLAAVDIAASLGATVIAAASSESKLSAAVAAGARYLINYRATSLRDSLATIAPDGVDYVVDPIGGDLALTALRTLAPYGSHLVLGFASGDIPRLGANRILLGNHTVIGVDFGDAGRREPTIVRPIFEELFALTVKGAIHPPTPTVYSLSDGVQALSAIASREVIGKLVLVP